MKMRKSKRVKGGLRKDGTPWHAWFLPSEKLPPREATTAVFVVPFYGDQIVVVKIQEDDHKGWDIPGGYLNKDESIEKALDREVYEEAEVKLSRYVPIGYLETDYNPKKTTYMAIFWGQVTDLRPFKAGFEAVERQLMTPGELQKKYGGGNPDLLKIVLEAALAFHRKQKQK